MSTQGNELLFVKEQEIEGLEKRAAKLIKKPTARQAERDWKVKKFFESDNQHFIAACEAVKLPPTKRQASKWLNKKGLAYKGAHE
jgi:hypothetical protein